MVRTKYFFVGSIFSFGTIGCWASEPIYVDSRFTQEQQALIQAAADDWSNATMGYGAIDFIWNAHLIDRYISDPPDNKRIMLRAFSYDKRIPANRDDRETDGLDHRRRLYPFENIIVDERIVIFVDKLENDPVHFRNVVRHELGHHFGINHIYGPATMTDGGISANCLTRSDINYFCRTNKCGRYVSWCWDPEQIGN